MFPKVIDTKSVAWRFSHLKYGDSTLDLVLGSIRTVREFIHHMVVIQNQKMDDDHFVPKLNPNPKFR